ncbi:hypothetical protein BCh11DRAFT_00401 [Burkholderia sp. Ch1-1]|nr:hypothetical protein BCh11DRAFT_00401 [Burkholderia sp. Ch1-1]
MSKKSFSDDAGDSNETTEQALVALTAQIKAFVENRSLDSRFAAKLVRRMKKASFESRVGGLPGQVRAQARRSEHLTRVGK